MNEDCQKSIIYVWFTDCSGSVLRYSFRDQTLFLTGDLPVGEVVTKEPEGLTDIRYAAGGNSDRRRHSGASGSFDSLFVFTRSCIWQGT